MFAAIDRLRTLKVSDVMSRDVIPISANQTMSDAAKTFAEHDIASAPVVDEMGRCVGMLSAADFMKRDCPHCSDTEPHKLSCDVANDCLSIDLPTDMVNCYMTDAIQTVAADESLLQAARMMSADHIHHLPVLARLRPVGVVSTMDVVAALINAVDEINSRVR